MLEADERDESGLCVRRAKIHQLDAPAFHIGLSCPSECVFGTEKVVTCRIVALLPASVLVTCCHDMCVCDSQVRWRALVS